MPLVSIAVAVYNGEKFLVQQLDTLLGQTYQNMEIIVSDDGSSDGTWAILETYAAKHANFFIYRNEGPRGIKRNFEHALKHCKGDLIAFSDQDDIWMLDKIEKLVAHIGDHALIYHNSLFVDPEGRSLNTTISTDLNPYRGNDPRAFLLWNTVSGHALLFRRGLLELALPFPAARHHDWWLAFIAAANGGIQYLDEVLVHYRQHEQSQTDFLKLRNKKTDREKKQAEAMEWYEACATVPGKYQPFFKEWVRRNCEKNDHIWNLRLFLLYFKARRSILFMRKKNAASKFFYMIKKCWGDDVRANVRNRKKSRLHQNSN